MRDITSISSRERWSLSRFAFRLNFLTQDPTTAQPPPLQDTLWGRPPMWTRRKRRGKVKIFRDRFSEDLRGGEAPPKVVYCSRPVSLLEWAETDDQSKESMIDTKIILMGNQLLSRWRLLPLKISFPIISIQKNQAQCLIGMQKWDIFHQCLISYFCRIKQFNRSNIYIYIFGYLDASHELECPYNQTINRFVGQLD